MFTNDVFLTFSPRQKCNTPSTAFLLLATKFGLTINTKKRRSYTNQLHRKHTWPWYSLLKRKTLSRWQIHVTLQHTLQLCKLRRRGQFTNCQSQHSFRTASRISLGKEWYSADHKIEGIQGSCSVFATVCLYAMDRLRTSRQKTQSVPHKLLQKAVEDYMTWQSLWYRSPLIFRTVACWAFKQC